jgi:uncharacterized protein YegL
MKDYDSDLDVRNPAARVPVVVLLDCSGSMEGEPIDELNRGLQRFFDEIRDDDAASVSAEIALATFASEARLEHGFASVFDYPDDLPPFKAEGLTATGAALELAEKLLAEREALYRAKGIPHYKPWVIVLTDGEPVPDKGWREPAERFKARAMAGELTYLCVGVGDSINKETLAELSAKEPGVVRLQGLKFSAFFCWLSASMHDVSVGSPGSGENVRLRGIGGWARYLGGPAR